jgi:mercuric ion transport protein
MNNAQLLKTGLMGSIMAALCCFTPVLAVLLGAVGLGWFIGYLDYVLVPVRVIFLGLVSYAVLRNAKKAR